MAGVERVPAERAFPDSTRKSKLDTLVHLSNRLALAATLVLLVGVAAIVVMRTMYSGKVMPSVYVADVSVGGMSRDDAYNAINQRSRSLLGNTFVFDYDGRQWTTSLSALGVQSDVQASVDAAFAVGREEAARDRVGSTLRVARGDRVVPLKLTVDSAQVQRWVTDVTNQIDRRAQNAQIAVVDGQVSVTSDVDGIIVDQQRLMAIIQESIDNLSPYRGPLPVKFDPAAIHLADLDANVAELTDALSQPITVTYKKKSWTLQPADVGQFLVTTPAATGEGYDLALDDAALGQYMLQLIGGRINREPVNAVIEWSDKKKKVVATSKSSVGVTMLAGPLADEIIASFFGDHANVDVPVRGLKPEIDDAHLDRLGITTKLATGSSAFYGSDEARATNIWVGTGYLNGTIVRPGEYFSFNNAIGDITAEAGYVEAPVVDGERIGKDVGGGICQVSTTAFRAAFLAGFPIGEWWPHLYRLPFYEYDGWQAGLDASILQSGPRSDWGDFTFKNSTDSYLLIEAWVQDQSDFVTIYGPDTGWDVYVSDPWEGRKLLGDDQPDIETVDSELPAGTIMQTEFRQDGLEISYQRIVTDRDGNVVDDWIAYSKFEARGDVWKVSPDMVGQSPATLNPHKVGSESRDDS